MMIYLNRNHQFFNGLFLNAQPLTHGLIGNLATSGYLPRRRPGAGPFFSLIYALFQNFRALVITPRRFPSVRQPIGKMCLRPFTGAARTISFQGGA